MWKTIYVFYVGLGLEMTVFSGKTLIAENTEERRGKNSRQPKDRTYLTDSSGPT
jgi:hypothetical protein